MRRLYTFLVVLGLAASAHAETIRVGAAVSLKEALGEIAKTYESDTGDSVTFVFGSSGQILQQIKSGAPIDAFVSAANKQVDELIATGQLDAATRRDVAGNTLVLIVPADGPAGIASFDDLAKPGVGRFAIGEPKTVPAGQYAEQALTFLKLLGPLKSKLVYGANVRQVLSYVERGEVAAGLVYATDAKEAAGKVRVVATVDAAAHDPIVYPAAVVKKSDRAVAARKFLDHLGSEKARAVLAAKGFALPKPQNRPATP